MTIHYTEAGYDGERIRKDFDDLNKKPHTTNKCTSEEIKQLFAEQCKKLMF